jgi:hypothetical protein
MAPTFTVGPALSVLNAMDVDAFANGLSCVCQQVFPVRNLTWQSPDLIFGGWQELQMQAEDLLGTEVVPNLLHAKERDGVFVSGLEKRIVISFEHRPQLRVSSLAGLTREIALFADVRGLPLDLISVIGRMSRRVYDEDEGIGIHTYYHLRIAMFAANYLNLPLWLT